MKAKLRIPLERDVQRAVLEYLAWRKIFAWRNQTTGIYDPRRGVFRAGQTLRGVPDVLGILPDGRFLGVEVKRPGKHLEPHQQEFQTRATALKAVCVCVHSAAELDAALTAEGVFK